MIWYQRWSLRILFRLKIGQQQKTFEGYNNSMYINYRRSTDSNVFHMHKHFDDKTSWWISWNEKKYFSKLTAIGCSLRSFLLRKKTLSIIMDHNLWCDINKTICSRIFLWIILVFPGFFKQLARYFF